MNSQQPISPLLIGSREAAQALSVCERTLWELTNRGDMPCVRIGRRVLYSPADLRTWIDRQKGGHNGQGKA